MTDIINFAHRGAAGHYPENTMLAFAKALEMGATGIETDVQMTRDGQLVLIHDETLQRTAGTSEWVKDLTLAEIKQREVGSWFHGDFAGERIPALEELLDLVRGTDTIVNIELKTGVVLYPGIEQKVVDAVRHYGLSERVIISSFNHYSLVECKRLAPDIRTGILYMEGLYEPWDYAKRIGAEALHAYQYALTPELVTLAKANEVVYHPFTVNDPKVMLALINAGVAGIITDFPDRLAELLAKQGV
ncbi:glycerophosphodiester phosphodiesterase [Paenibacillus sp. DXFW5]|uniref:Glycerophosphodiester phosphodiesterase n=1 Tax=Paenibacillus rhizolycopersici TaxID=2780073 RepID=A0ABS2H051_9BACL|nr:glycerophosphodiester phosphodiesterase [Paenibacillus rhizolycopersici]MBM6994597.1 glycerophosphodiester phosphodiesterase [Paenibacillus rhizolycopersici]